MTDTPPPAEIYQAYFVPAMVAPWARVLVDRVRPGAGDRMLDVACGTGVVARMIAPVVGVTGRAVGLDVSAPMLAVARRLPLADHAPVEWREENALAMALADASFDLVVCQQGLQFFSDRAAGVREMRRVLRAGGRVAVACWQSLEHNPVSRALIHAEARLLDEPAERLGRAFSLAEADELHALFAAAGFSHVDVMAHAMTVRFPHPERFVRLTIESAAAAVPALARMEAAARAKLADDIASELRGELAAYIEGNALAVPTAAHIVVAD